LRVLFVGAILEAAVVCSQAGPVCAAAPVITKGPYLTNPSATAVTVQYETNAPGDGLVKFGDGSALDQTAPAKLHEKIEYTPDSKTQKSSKVAAYLYRARLAGLKPGTVYRYEVVPSGKADGPPLPVQAFRTFATKAEPITFIAYGDSRSYPDRHRALAVNFLKHKPAFILNNGDLVQDSGAYKQWGPQFFAPLEDIIDRVPMLVCRGSHETEAKHMLRLFEFPTDQVWYSFDCGPVHVVVLDSRKDDVKVLRWLEDDLGASKAPWKIAMYHNPSFNFSSHRSDKHRTTFLPILEKYGVDVVISGHSHMYERFRPLVRQAPTWQLESRTSGSPSGVSVIDVPRRPITFINTGGGAARLHDVVQHPLLAKAVKIFHYCVFAADAENLRLQTFAIDGREIDAMTIAKKDGVYDNAYLAEARTMEAAVLAQGGISLAAPTLTSLPAKSTIAIPVKICFPSLREPVAVNVALAEASAGDYSMDPVALKVKPSKEVGVTLKIESHGKATLRKDENDPLVSHLVPPLRFVMHAKGTTFEQTLETSDVIVKKQ
jgi:hypothetical protein